jgi:hypothetical protein
MQGLIRLEEAVDDGLEEAVARIDGCCCLACTTARRRLSLAWTKAWRRLSLAWTTAWRRLLRGSMAAVAWLVQRLRGGCCLLGCCPQVSVGTDKK